MRYQVGASTVGRDTIAQPSVNQRLFGSEHPEPLPQITRNPAQPGEETRAWWITYSFEQDGCTLAIAAALWVVLVDEGDDEVGMCGEMFIEVDSIWTTSSCTLEVLKHRHERTAEACVVLRKELMLVYGLDLDAEAT